MEKKSTMSLCHRICVVLSRDINLPKCKFRSQQMFSVGIFLLAMLVSKLEKSFNCPSDSNLEQSSWRVPSVMMFLMDTGRHSVFMKRLLSQVWIHISSAGFSTVEVAEVHVSATVVWFPHAFTFSGITWVQDSTEEDSEEVDKSASTIFCDERWWWNFFPVVRQVLFHLLHVVSLVDVTWEDGKIF